MQNYIEKASRTEPKYDGAVERLSNHNTVALLHAGMGLSTEANEFLDAIKKYVFYGREIDKVNLIEEIGDALWYIAIACRVLEVEIEECMSINIAKLMKRFPDAFDEDLAIRRTLDEERKLLEERVDGKKP